MHRKLSLTTHFSQKIIFALFFLVTATGIWWYSVAEAVTPTGSIFAGDSELEGYAWSSTIGWISLNCSNTNTCGTSDYKVILQSDDQLVGYAWSSSIGWVKFGDLSGFPVASGNSQVNADVISNGAGGWRLNGWARACAGTQSGNCSSMTSRSDGWDGWISLRGTNHSVDVTNGVVPTTGVNRFAWGSDVVGWIDWSGVRIVATPQIITFTGTPQEMPLGGTATLTWETQGFDTCQASNDNGDTGWTTPVAVSAGQHTKDVTPPLGTTIYQLTCQRGTDTPVTQTVSISAMPNLVLSGPAISGTLPSPQPDGTYDGVQFLAAVNGIPTGETPSYTFTFGPQTLTGTVNPPGSVNNFNPPLVLNNVTFGTYQAVLEIDFPAPGAILENLTATPQDEDVIDNRGVQNNIFIPPAPPTFSLTADDEYVRTDSSTDLRWSVTAPYVADCEIRGNGVNILFTTSGDYLVAETGSTPTPPLRSTTEYLLSCTEPTTSSVFTTTAHIELIPDYTEI